MKKAILALLVLGAAAFAGWWFFLRAQGSPPGVASRLEAEHTLGFWAVEGPELLASELGAAVARMTEKAPAEVRAAVSADLVVQQAHFDPRKADGWTGIGVDPKVGMALALDGRLKGQPVVLLGLADQGKFLSWIEKLQGQAPKYEEGSPAVLSIGDRRYFVGKRGEFTAITPAEDELKAGFQAFLAGSGAPLTGHEVFKTGFREAREGARLTWWADLVRLAALVPDETDRKVAAFYAELFPGLTLTAGPGGGSLRLVATEKGAEALRQMLVPAGDAPNFSAWVPGDWVAVRSSFNLKEVFAGVEALLPPTVPAEAKSGLGMLRLGVAMATGVTWDELVEAFGGHVVVAINPATIGKGHPEGLLLLSATAKADRVLDALSGKAGDLLGSRGGEGAQVEKVTIAGVEARQLPLGPVTIVAGRVDDLLVIASSKAVFEAAVARKGEGSLQGTPAAEALDGEVVYGVAMSVASLKTALGSAGGVAPEVLAGIDPGQSHLVFAISHDRHGLVSKGDGHWLLGAGGTMASLAAPFFLFAHRTAEVRVEAIRAEQEAAEAMRRELEAAPPPDAPETDAPEAPATDGE